MKQTLFITLFIAMALLTGCKSTTSTQVTLDCQLPQSKSLELAIGQSQAALQNQVCHRDFDRHFGLLLATGEGDPGEKNKALFRDYLLFAEGHGVISKRQMKATFSRHFSETFVSLSDSVGVCQAASELEKVADALDAELMQKKQGLQKVLGDNKSYYAATRQRQSALMILAATGQACGAGV